MTETRFRTFLAGIALGTSLAFAAPASAEVSEVTLANQFSLSHLPLMIMKDQQFIEKQLAAQGLPDTKVNWISLAGSSAMIDGLLSGSLHVASTGTSGFAVLWDKTKGQVKSLGAQAYNVLNLVTRLPGVEKLEDLPLDTKIAVPAVGTSPQALALKIAALQKFGPFDTKTSSWLKTPPEVRRLGGALFGDYRYGRVFIYHNGAQSYYGARGFRGILRV